MPIRKIKSEAANTTRLAQKRAQKKAKKKAKKAKKKAKKTRRPLTSVEIEKRLSLLSGARSKTECNGGLNVSHLQVECIRRGILSTGGREQLTDRIIAHTMSTSPTAAPAPTVVAAAAELVVSFDTGVGDFTFGHRMVAIRGCSGPSTAKDVKYPLIIYRRGGATTLLTPKCVLGTGNFGSVVSYEGGVGIYYVIKVERVTSSDTSNAYTEHPTIRALSSVACGQIGSRVIGVHGYWYGRRLHRGAFSLLEAMDGSLGGDVGVVSGHVKLYQSYYGLRSYGLAAVHIAEDVRKQLLCLLENNPRHMYHDLKVENVMYTHDAVTGEVLVKVGDLGSLVPDRHGRYVSTFPCLPSNKFFQSFPSLEDNKGCLAYQVGIFLARLLRIDIVNLYQHAEMHVTNVSVRKRSKIKSGKLDKRRQEELLLREATNAGLMKRMRAKLRASGCNPDLSNLIHIDPLKRLSVESSLY